MHRFISTRNAIYSSFCLTPRSPKGNQLALSSMKASSLLISSKRYPYLLYMGVFMFDPGGYIYSLDNWGFEYYLLSFPSTIARSQISLMIFGLHTTSVFKSASREARLIMLKRFSEGKNNERCDWISNIKMEIMVAPRGAVRDVMVVDVLTYMESMPTLVDFGDFGVVFNGFRMAVYAFGYISGAFILLMLEACRTLGYFVFGGDTMDIITSNMGSGILNSMVQSLCVIMFISLPLMVIPKVDVKGSFIKALMTSDINASVNREIKISKVKRLDLKERLVLEYRSRSTCKHFDSDNASDITIEATDTDDVNGGHILEQVKLMITSVEGGVVMLICRFVPTSVDAYRTPFIKEYLYGFLSKFVEISMSLYPSAKVLSDGNDNLLVLLIGEISIAVSTVLFGTLTTVSHDFSEHKVYDEVLKQATLVNRQLRTRENSYEKLGVHFGKAPKLFDRMMNEMFHVVGSVDRKTYDCYVTDRRVNFNFLEGVCELMNLAHAFESIQDLKGYGYCSAKMMGPQVDQLIPLNFYGLFPVYAERFTEFCDAVKLKPAHRRIVSIQEPFVKMEMLAPRDYFGLHMEYAQNRTKFNEMKYIMKEMGLEGHHIGKFDEVLATLGYMLRKAVTFLLFHGHSGYNFNLTRGRVILLEGWNDMNNSCMRIMSKCSVVIFFSYLGILCENGNFKNTLKLFHKLVNGLDPPKGFMVSLEDSMSGNRHHQWTRLWTSFSCRGMEMM